MPMRIPKNFSRGHEGLDVVDYDPSLLEAEGYLVWLQREVATVKVWIAKKKDAERKKARHANAEPPSA